MLASNTTIADASGATQPNHKQRLLLHAFILFACGAFLVGMAMFISNDFAERILPHYGWPVIGFFYLGALKYAIPPLTDHNPVPIHVYFRGIWSTLRILALYGTLTALIGWATDDFENPYLMVSWVQPIWTVAVPLAWLLLFRQASHAASRPAQDG